MKHKDVKEYFLDWTEGRVDEKTRPKIQSHLDGCGECRTYFAKMSLFLDKPDYGAIPRLEPDAFLPAKIRALAQPAPEGPVRKLAWGRFSLAGAALALAVVIGITLGSGLTAESYSSEETEIVETYSQVFSFSGFADDWETIVEDEQEENGDT